MKASLALTGQRCATVASSQKKSHDTVKRFPPRNPIARQALARLTALLGLRLPRFKYKLPSILNAAKLARWKRHLKKSTRTPYCQHCFTIMNMHAGCEISYPSVERACMPPCFNLLRRLPLEGSTLPSKDCIRIVPTQANMVPCQTVFVLLLSTATHVSLKNAMQIYANQEIRIPYTIDTMFV